MKQSFLERADGLGFVVPDVEDGVQFGDLQQVMDLLGKFEQLQLAALVANGSKRAHQFADTRTVNVGDVSQIQKNLLIAVRDQIAHRIAQHDAAFAERDSSAQVHHRHAIHLSRTGLHSHFASSVCAPEFPGTSLIKVISVPGARVRNCTSSIKERMRKIPRPDCFSKFSGASGLGTSSSHNPGPSSAMVMTSASPVFSNETRTFLRGS